MQVPNSEDKLALAVHLGMHERLSEFGYSVTSTGGNKRGSHIELSNGWVVVDITADWLEGEITITVNHNGKSESINELVVLGKGTDLRRLSRGVSRDVVGAQLTKVANALIEQVPHLFQPHKEP